MSESTRNSKQLETLAWITDDEAEFWTSVSPEPKDAKFHFPASEEVNFGDGLYFKKTDELNSDEIDHLSLLYKNSIDSQVKEIEENAERKQISDIFQLNKDDELSEHIPGVQMSFLDRLIHQLTRPPESKEDYFTNENYADDDFIEIDEAEITAAVNDETNTLHSDDEKNRSKNILFFFSNFFRSFLDEVNEETDVIRGTLDEETFLNRRSRLAKTSSVINQSRLFFSQTFF